jgi:hypothetical protein
MMRRIQSQEDAQTVGHVMNVLMEERGPANSAFNNKIVV